MKSVLLSTLIVFSWWLNQHLGAEAREQIEKLDTGIANIYLLTGSNPTRPILVDSSAASNEAYIEDWLKSFGVRPQDLDLIILTHGHTDHAGGASYFTKKYQIPVLVGRGDLEMLETGKNEKNLNYTSLLAGFVSLYVKDIHYEPFEPTQIIDQEISLKAYGLNARVLPLPGGHTDGSLAVVFDDSHEAIIGDLIRGDLFQEGLAAEHFFHQNRQLTRWQLWYLMKYEGVKIFHPGHFGSFNSEEVIQKFFPEQHFKWPSSSLSRDP